MLTASRSGWLHKAARVPGKGPLALGEGPNRFQALGRSLEAGQGPLLFPLGYCCSGPAVLVVTNSVEPSSVAGTGTLWLDGVVAGSSLGVGQSGAEASGVPEERM